MPTASIPSSRVDLARKPSPASIMLGIAAVALAVVLVYWPAMNGGFIWDDEVLLSNTSLIRDPHGLYRIWFTADAADYWPVTNSSFWIEWRLWGTHTLSYHLTNLALHIAASLLIWTVLRKLAIPGAFLAALLFAVHPVNVEAVAWIAQRKTVLALVFFLVSILGYLRANKGRGSWYVVSLIAFVLAVLSKGSVVILPLVLLLIVWWQKNRFTVQDLAKVIPFFALAVPLVIVNVWFQTHGSGEPIRDVTWLDRLLGAGAAVWFYLSKAIVPLNLSFVYPQWTIDAGNPAWWLPLAAAIGATLAFWHWRGVPWVRATLFAWAFYWIALLPALGFVDVYFMRYALVADHYQYVALIAIVALVAAGWDRWYHSVGDELSAQAPPLIATGIVVAGLAGIACLQAAKYRDAETLYRDTLTKNPTCWMVFNNLGLILGQRGELVEAKQQFDEALRLKPDSADAHSNLGNVLAQTGHPEQAIELFRQATKLDPRLLSARYNLATLLARRGQTPQAIDEFREIVRLKPDFVGGQIMLGQLLVLAGQLQQAVEAFDAATRAAPDDPAAWANLAAARFGAGQPTEARAAGQRAIELARAQEQSELAQQLDRWLTSRESDGAAPASELPAKPLPATALPPPP